MRRYVAAFLFLFLLVARVTSAQTTGGISGTVTLFETALEIRPSIQIYDASGALVKTVSLGQTEIVRSPSTDTIPWTVTGLPPGTYYVRTFNPISPSSGFRSTLVSGPWIDELFDNIRCVAADCRVTGGTPVTVIAGQTAGPVNMTLDIGASISGDATLLGSQSFDILDSRGVLLPNRIAPYPQAAFYADGLPAGTYFLLAHRVIDNSAPNTLYQNVPCDGCAVTFGTPVTVAAGESKTGLSFGKPSAGGISGTVRSNGSASPPNTAVNNATVNVYAANGALAATATTASDGSYSVTALAPGSYFVATSNVQGFVNQTYQNSTCAGCSPTTGTPVSVSAASTTTGVDFSLAAGTIVSGTVAGADGSALIPDVLVYTASPDSPIARVTPVVQESPGPGPSKTFFAVFSATVPQGSYVVQTGPLAGFTQQIYNGVTCPQGACPTVFATPVTVGSSTVTGINFSLPACTASTIAPVSLATAAVGIAYRQTLLASGANGPVRFVVSSGALPPGLSLDPNTGVLSGTPTTSGRFTFTIAAVDNIACGGTRTYTLDVPACVVNSGFLGFSTIVPAPAGGWTIPYTTTCSSLNATTNVSWIMSVSAANGVISYATAQNTGATRQGAIALGPRVFTVIQSGAVDAPPFGSVDAPTDGAIVSGSVGISGWALDDHFVSEVSLWRDPVAGEAPQQVFIGFATFVPGARPDVVAAFPALPLNDRAGWGYLLLTNMLPNHGNGTFRISVYATDVQVGFGVPSTSHRTLLGTKIINAVNASATAPFGAIDTPGQGATVSGTNLVNFGWVLTPQPKMMPFDGSTIRVLIDGVDVGTLAAYNLFRPDVSGLFPGLKNSGGPVGYRVIDTTALAEGMHTIAWLATDDGGATNGIGSRFFTVSNGAWQPSLRASAAAAPPAVTSSELAQADATTAVPARVDGVDLGRKAASLAALAPDDAGARMVTMTNLQSLALSLIAGSKDPAYDVGKPAPSNAVGRVFRPDSDVSAVGRVFRPGDNECAATYAGYLVVNGELHPLPIGSSLDPAGTFYWHPGPGFFGRYHLLFVRTSCDGAQQRIPVTVIVN